MNVLKVTRWEFQRITRSKQFWIMTLLLPVLIFAIVFFLIQSEADENGAFSEPPPPFIYAIGLALLLFIAAFMSGVLMLYGVIKEKNSRVVEIVLSSIAAKDLMMGKILGQGLAGLLGAIIWALGGLIVLSRFTPVSFAILTPMQWVFFPMYFVFGYLLMGTLYATAGAAMKDIHSGGVIGLVGIIPYLPIPFLSFIIEHPDTSLVKMASFFPPFTPSIMMFRMALTTLAWWEAPLSLAVLIVFVYALSRFAAKVFETALLMYGKSASLREIWRWGVRKS